MSRFPAPRGNAYATKIQAQSIDKAEYHGYAGAQDLAQKGLPEVYRSG